MDFPQLYAIAAGGVFVILIIIKHFPSIKRLIRLLILLASEHLTYPLVLRRYRFLGPWSRADVLIQLAYLAINIFLITFGITSFKDAWTRAGTVSVVNLMPLFFGFHLSFLADLLGVSLSTYRRIHRSVGSMSFLVGLFHVLAAVQSNSSYSLDASKNLYGLIGASSLGLLMLLSFRFLRRPSYEFFLRIHQALAFLCAYVLWQHLSWKPLLPRACIYISTGIFCSTSALQLCSILYHNSVLRRGFLRAFVTEIGDAFKITLTIPGRLQAEAGQYINLWIPSINFTSFLQSHPFMIASCEEGEDTTLILFIEPRNGLTSRLSRHLDGKGRTKPVALHRALFSGPHGSSAPLDKFERVLLVASGFGIFAQLPYLRQLIRGHNSFEARTRRTHLVWQLKDIRDGAAAQTLLNQVLMEDKLDGGYTLRISIYYLSGDPNPGNHRRVFVYKGLANLEEVFQEEAVGGYGAGVLDSGSDKLDSTVEPEWDTKTLVEAELGSNTLNAVTQELESGRLVDSEKKGGKMLVTVSASEKIRDDLRRIVRGYLKEKVSLLELDYQPSPP